jgi:hypothetical protein
MPPPRPAVPAVMTGLALGLGQTSYVAGEATVFMW